ncbi:hypothetical protein QUF72_02760 [Desulfobacterales bacterium HSG2]|nr:hypothetical protein [Desulfobacterales bacterium HSG2]
MKTPDFSNLSASDIKSLAKVHEQSISEHEWTRADQISLSDMEQVRVDGVASRLINDETSLMNEATIWARGIYPLLALAEEKSLRFALNKNKGFTKRKRSGRGFRFY